MIAPVWIVGFSGNRNLPDEQLARKHIQEVLKELQTKARDLSGRVEFFGSVAYGGDLVAAETARELGIPVHLILPKAEDHFRTDFAEADGSFHEADWSRAQALIADARAGKNGGTLRLARSSHVAPDCYYDAGVELLDAADMLLVLWDHEPARGLGGTEQMLQHADTMGLPVITIHAGNGAIERRRMESFAHPKEPGLLLLQEVDRFSSSGASSLAQPTESVAEVARRLERCCGGESRRFRDLLLWMIRADGVATLLAAAAALLPHHGPGGDFWAKVALGLACVELLLVGWALWQNRQLRARHTHERWMQTRFAAELLRAMRSACGLIDPLYPQVTRHEPDWRRVALSLGLLVHRECWADADWRKARHDYVAQRLRNLPDGQIPYFNDHQAEAEPLFRRNVLWGTRFARLAVVFVLGAVVKKAVALVHTVWPFALVESLHHLNERWGGGPGVLANIAFQFLPIALPLCAGYLLSVRNALDSGRRTYRYADMVRRLTAMATRLEALQTEASVRRAVAATEEILLDELIEWHISEKQNGAH